jgi:hypothetical protein
MSDVPVIMIVEFNDLSAPLCTAYYIPADALTPEQTATVIAADHRMYSEWMREMAKDGLCERDPVHSAMIVIKEVRHRIIDTSVEQRNVVHKVTFAYMNEDRWMWDK